MTDEMMMDRRLPTTFSQYHARTQNFVANVGDREGREALPKGLTRGVTSSQDSGRQSC
jgi:hypothetical protein